MKQKTLLILLPPLVTAIPLLIHSPIKAHADTSIKIVAMNKNGKSTSTGPTTESITSSSPSLINSAPDTGITASQPASITTKSQVSDYVPVNVINKNKAELQKQKEAKEAYLRLVAKQEAIAKAKELAEKKAKEQEKARALAELQQKQQEEKLKNEQAEQARKEAELVQQAQTEAQTTQEETETQAQQSQATTPVVEEQPSTTQETTTTAPSYEGGLDMSQTSGVVDITALANYMASTVGGAVDKWIYTIQHESGGDLQNWYNKAGGNPYTQGSTAYGVFQLLGHGEYLGMPLKDQITLAQQVFQSQGWGAWVASYGY